MASKVVGHIQCPECDYPDAEVKTTKNPALLHRYCPDCTAQFFPRSVEASERLKSKMRPYGTVEEPAPAEKPKAKPVDKPKEPPAAPAPKARSALDILVGGEA